MMTSRAELRHTAIEQMSTHVRGLNVALTQMKGLLA